MELFMKRVYLATAIAIVVTTSIASHVLTVGVLGPAAPGLLTGLKSGARGLFGRLWSLVSDCIAAARARRERRAALVALRLLNDRELKDIGLYRNSISDDPCFLERERKSRIRD
jgi:uncharacterized protein YjiS (DUF1127 family)